MLKVRIIPILTFNGFALVKTKHFSNPRMVGNPVQAARVYNSRGVDELIFVDIFATKQKRKINHKVVENVINECFMPVGIGGGVSSLDDINDLLKIGADKAVIKTEALKNIKFIKEAVDFFGSQCITIAVDVIKSENGDYFIHNDENKNILLADFLDEMEACNVGEYVVTNTDLDGTMLGYDIKLVNEIDMITQKPIIVAGGAGSPNHILELFKKTNVNAAAASSMYHFTQFTPHDVKKCLSDNKIPVRI